MSGLSYAKWDSIKDTEDENLHELSSERLGTFNPLQLIKAMKLYADDLFQTAESSGKQRDYEIALNDGYRKVYEKLDEIVMCEESVDEIKSLQISAAMNIAACYLKLSLWDECITICTDVMKLHGETLLPEILLRVRYFRAVASLKSDCDSGIATAYWDVDGMNNLLESYPTAADDKAKEEYQTLFDLVQQEQHYDEPAPPYQLSSASSTVYFDVPQQDPILRSLVQDRTPLPIYNKNNKMLQDLDGAAGWRLYENQLFQDAADWFSGEITKQRMQLNTNHGAAKERSSVEEDARDTRLSKLYDGLGKSLLALGHEKQAAAAFQSAADLSHIYEEKANFSLKAANLYSKQKENKLALISFEAALSSLTITHKGLLECNDENDNNKVVPPLEALSSIDRVRQLTAIAQNGIGHCHIKTKNYQQAIDPLKASIEYGMHTLFSRPHDNNTTVGEGGCSYTRGTTAASPSSNMCNKLNGGSQLLLAEVTRLVNSIELLSDSYASLRDWAHAIDTIDLMLDVCLSVLTAFLAAMTLYQSTVDSSSSSASCSSRQSTSSSSALITSTAASSMCDALKFNYSITVPTTTSDTVTTAAEEVEVNKVSAAAVTESLELPEASVQEYILVLRRRRAGALIARGHILEAGLLDGHEFTHSVLLKDCCKVGSGDGQVPLASPAVSVPAPVSESASKTIMTSRSKNKGGSTNTKASNKVRVQQRRQVEEQKEQKQEQLKPIEIIAMLWEQGAGELAAVGCIEQALSAYKSLGGLWSGAAGVEPYSDSLLYHNSSTSGSGSLGGTDSARRSHSTATPTTSSNDPGTSTGSTEGGGGTNIATGTNASTSTNNEISNGGGGDDDRVSKEEAAERGYEAWLSASKLARELADKCGVWRIRQHPAITYTSSGVDDDGDGDEVDGSEAENQDGDDSNKRSGSNNGNGHIRSDKPIVDTLKPCSRGGSIDILMGLSALQQQLLCLYEAGLCGMAFDIHDALRSFESAKDIKQTYELLVLTRENSCSHTTDASFSSELNPTKPATATASSRQQQQQKQQQKKIFHTLCFDLSFHLCVAYLRTSKPDDAADEILSAMLRSTATIPANAAITGASNDIDSRGTVCGGTCIYDKIRLRKGWSIAAIACATARRSGDAENVLTQLRGLYEGPIEDPECDIAELRYIVNRLQNDPHTGGESSLDRTADADTMRIASTQLHSGNQKTNTVKEWTKSLNIRINRFLDALLNLLRRVLLVDYLCSLFARIKIPKEEDVDFARWITISALLGALLGILMFLYIATRPSTVIT